MGTHGRSLFPHSVSLHTHAPIPLLISIPWRLLLRCLLITRVRQGPSCCFGHAFAQTAGGQQSGPDTRTCELPPVRRSWSARGISSAAQVSFAGSAKQQCGPCPPNQPAGGVSQLAPPACGGGLDKPWRAHRDDTKAALGGTADQETTALRWSSGCSGQKRPKTAALGTAARRLSDVLPTGSLRSTVPFARAAGPPSCLGLRLFTLLRGRPLPGGDSDIDKVSESPMHKVKIEARPEGEEHQKAAWTP